MSVDEQSPPDTDFSLDANAKWIELTSFECIMGKWGQDARSNDLILGFRVDGENKAAGLKVTDFPSRIMRVKIELKTFDGWEE
jgi:hypothetical protein